MLDREVRTADQMNGRVTSCDWFFIKFLHIETSMLATTTSNLNDTRDRSPLSTLASVVTFSFSNLRFKIVSFGSMWMPSS